MLVVNNISEIIVLIAFYLSIMLLIVYKKKDISIANFAWGGGCALITFYLLPLPRRFPLLVFFFIFWTIVNHIYNPHYRDNQFGSFANSNWWYIPTILIVLGLLILKQQFPIPFSGRALLVTLLVGMWALRMVVHLYHRYTGKDPRFITWRQQAGEHGLAMHVGYIFGAQLFLMLIMSVPSSVIILHNTPGINLLDCLAVLMWIAGFVCESISDYQLFAFMKDEANHGKLMRYGLWRYSRHPNYFGEVVQWWALFLLALSVPDGWVAIIAPVTITLLLLFVSGIPLNEKVMAQHPEFDEYKKHTNIFIPWFVKQ